VITTTLGVRLPSASAAATATSRPEINVNTKHRQEGMATEKIIPQRGGAIQLKQGVRASGVIARKETTLWSCANLAHVDIEVLLKTYGSRGEPCLDELRGMFTFAMRRTAACPSLAPAIEHRTVTRSRNIGADNKSLSGFVSQNGCARANMIAAPR
jgi:hypothetical protein